MRVRKLSAAAAAVLALAGLSACRSNVGAAAVVGGHRISESDVHKYLLPAGQSSAAISQATQNGAPLPPAKALALNWLVQQRVFERTLASGPGGVPSDAALRALHDTALSQAFQASQTGAQLDAAIATAFGSAGLTTTIVPIIVRTVELEFSLINRIKATATADLARAISAAHVSVNVNPAYGHWDSASYSVSPPSGATGSPAPCPVESSACTSGFLTLQSATPTASPTG